MTEDKQYTWEPITIKPNDQNLVGEVVKKKDWPDNEMEGIKDVGSIYFISDSFVVYNIDLPWLIRREVKEQEKMENCICYGTEYSGRSVCGVPCPVHLKKKKEKKVWAFGWYWNIGDYLLPGWKLSLEPLESMEDFKFRYRHDNYIKHIWPAKMNPNGTFTEPE